MSKSIKVDLRQLHHVTSIPAVIRTVNAAFSSDPLIQWLRPNAAPRAQPDDSVWEWQYRRIQTVMAYGKVLHSASVQDMALQFPQKQNAFTESVDTSLTKDPQSSITRVSGAEDAGAVVFLFPPKEQLCWSISRLWLVLKLFLLDILKPVHDSGSNESRVDQLLAANKNGLQSVQTQSSNQKIWYLEVIAVHPSLQSRGIGRGVMRWILEHVGDQPIYLECTCRENIGFYKSFGFKVVEEVELIDKEQSLKYWAMVRSEEVSQEQYL